MVSPRLDTPPVESSWKERLPLAAVTTFTLQDFPGRTACILWFSGCQMRCPYCHNPEMATASGPRLNVDDTLRYLRERRRFLDGVTLSGGECLLSSAILELAKEIKGMGYQLKVDTNGATPERLESLLESGLVDYVALDYKVPLHRYQELTGWNGVESWERSFRLLQRHGVDCELRTTVYPGLVGEEDVNAIMDYLERAYYSGPYYIQHYKQPERTLGGLSEPTRRFDISRLKLKRPFRVGFRNFTAREIAAI